MELTYPIQQRCAFRADLAAWVQGAPAALKAAALIASAPLVGLAFLIGLPIVGLYLLGAAVLRRPALGGPCYRAAARASRRSRVTP